MTTGVDGNAGRHTLERLENMVKATTGERITYSDRYCKSACWIVSFTQKGDYDWMKMMTEWLMNPLFWIVAVSTLVGIGVWVGKINEHRSTVQDFMEEIRKDIKQILVRMGPAVLESNSPVELTDLGRSISQTLGANVWAQDVAEELASRIEEMQPYDIEKMSFEYVSEEFKPETDMDTKIKQCAFENGLKHKQVLDVLAIELRDKLLALDKPL